MHFQKQEGTKKEIIVLDPKRSNAINIGLTVLPPKGTIKTAILKMDNSILNRECIDVSEPLSSTLLQTVYRLTKTPPHVLYRI